MKNLPNLTSLLAFTALNVLAAAPQPDFGELIFEDHFERSESQETRDVVDEVRIWRKS